MHQQCKTAMRLLTLALCLTAMGACATLRHGAVKYIEFDAELKEYPDIRPNTYNQKLCGLTLPQYTTEMNKVVNNNPGATGLKDFEIYGKSCFNIRGEVVK
ncbi:MAG: hypothetical protein NXI24_04885 [bacterium]|nr:hypothetical protein [bacterium]